MGEWSLNHITSTSDDLNGQMFGTNFRVRLQLSYTPATQKTSEKLKGVFGSQSSSPSFVESPVLHWYEKFTTVNHHDNQYWEFDANMFRLKPGSPTFDAWSKRYIAAYKFVTNVPVAQRGLRKGSVEFYDRKGRPLPADKFKGKPAASDGEKAGIIREYLAKNGGVFDIEIHDIPSIDTNNPDRHVERLVLFDCGLEGVGQRVKAMQYLNVSAQQRERVFEVSGSGSFSRSELPTQGLQHVNTPANVSTPNDILLDGESY